MKKAFYMMAAAAIALSSCSSEETTDVAKSSTITFRTTVGLNSRGAELTSDNLQAMWVSAFYQNDGKSYFDDQKFTKETGTGTSTFIPEAPQYWQEGKTYKFVAISPAKEEWPVTPTITKDQVTCTDLVPASTITDQKDLIIGAVDATSKNHDTEGVALTLNHILSQIKIQVKSDNEHIVYRIKGIRIVNVEKDKGTLTYSTTDNQATWDLNGGQKVTYSYTFPQPIILDGKTNGVKEAVLTGENGGAMIIPQDITPWDGNKVTDQASYNGGTYISLLLNVKAVKGTGYMYPAGAQGENSYGWVAVAVPNNEWEIGNKYIYTLDMSTGCGKVDPVDPEEDKNNPVVKPGQEGNPDKGENIFGDVVKFKVTVKPWDTPKIGDIDMSTGTIKKENNSPAKKK